MLKLIDDICYDPLGFIAVVAAMTLFLTVAWLTGSIGYPQQLDLAKPSSAIVLEACEQ